MCTALWIAKAAEDATSDGWRQVDDEAIGFTHSRALDAVSCSEQDLIVKTVQQVSG